MPHFYSFKILHNLGQGITNVKLSNTLMFSQMVMFKYKR